VEEFCNGTSIAALLFQGSLMTILMRILKPMLCLAGISVVCWAQLTHTDPVRPAFDAASFKLSADQTPSSRRSDKRDPGRIEFHGVTLQGLLWEAYHDWYYQIVWPQDWKDARSVKYDLVATLPPGVSKERIPEMLQTLMRERLQFKMHRELRDIPVYALSVAKSGLLMQKADADPNADPQNPPDVEILTVNQERRVQGRVTMTYLLLALAGNLDRPLVDTTGLEGEYQIDLRFTPMQPRSPSQPSPEDPVADYLSAAGSLVTALEKQCGIHVEARKAPIDMLIIDHINRTPSEN
jgi:uncharacterized protein (TIGR03435 family)